MGFYRNQCAKLVKPVSLLFSLFYRRRRRHYYYYCYFQETREYKLPEDLPVSPRMNNKGGRVSTEPFWMSIPQGSLAPLPPLPPLKKSESYATFTSVNRDSRIENVSQFSLAE